MVDLDTNKVVKSCGDEDSILPSILSKPLKTSLSLAVNCTATSEVNYNVLISDAFLNFFVQSCGHYSKFIKTCGDNKFFEVRIIAYLLLYFISFLNQEFNNISK